MGYTYVKQVGLSPPHSLKAQFSLKTHIISNLPIKNKSDIRGKKPSDINPQLPENEVSHVNFA